MFTVRDAIKSTIDQPSLAYRPLQLWQVAPEAVTAIEVQRGTEKYRLSREGGGWKLTRPIRRPGVGPGGVGAGQPGRRPRGPNGTKPIPSGDAAKYGLDRAGPYG